MAIRSGRLNHKLQILSFTVSQDEMGQPVKTYAHKAYAWANVAAVSGREKMTYSREAVASLMFKIEMRYLDDLDAKDRIKFNNYDLEILSISPRGRQLRETIEILCEVADVGAVVNV